ncbi:hypothetical protein CAC42_5081 [Sphaceloma murrayae]|uniref:Uncharacterized protein n=1 Tax=Sphaceloma murrayae TaxID=2082308 RepID=A0A2K1QU10_9PEZI|nr:hypothetical protein CAC42_5081 [Sphaceloma murrayae]
MDFHYMSIPVSFAHTEPLFVPLSRTTSADSIESAESIAPTSSHIALVLPRRRQSDYDNMDALSKETMGLPIFISSSTGAAVSSASPGFSSPSTFAAHSTAAQDSIISGKRISQALDFALTSLELIIVKSEELIVKSAGLLLDTTDEEEIEQRDPDAESERSESICNAIKDQDGRVEGWLD